MPPLVTGIVELVLLTLAAHAIGHRLLKLLRISRRDDAFRDLSSVAIGLGALQFLPFTLFALRIGTPIAFRISVACLLLMLFKEMLKSARRILIYSRTLGALDPPCKLLAAALALLAGGILCRAVCPAVDGDPLSYHLTAALRLLYLHHFAYLPTLTYTNWPIGEQMLFALLLGISRSSPPAIVQFLYGVLVFASGGLLAFRIGGQRATVIAVSLFLLYGLVQKEFLGEMTAAYIDTGLMLYAVLTISSLYLATTAAESASDTVLSENKEAKSLLTLCALFAGLAITIKLTGVWLCFAVVATWVRYSGRDLRKDIAWICRFVGIAAAVALPYVIKSWILTGNPVYPFLYKVFGGIEWTSEGMARFSHGNLIWNTPPGMQPTETVLKLSHLFNAAVGTAIAAASLLLMRRNARSIPARPAAVFIACICITTFFHTRFIMPVVPVLLVMLAVRISGSRSTTPVAAVCLSAVLAAVQLITLNPRLSTALPVSLGIISEDGYRKQAMPDYEITEAANRLLSPESRVLVGTYENNLAYYHAEALWPEWWLQDSVHYDSQARLLADFKRLHIQYLVLKPEFPDWCHRSHSCRERMEREPVALAELAREHGVPLYSANGHTLYKIDLGL